MVQERDDASCVLIQVHLAKPKLDALVRSHLRAQCIEILLALCCCEHLQVHICCSHVQEWLPGLLPLHAQSSLGVWRRGRTKPFIRGSASVSLQRSWEACC